MRIGISITAKLSGGSVIHLKEILNEWIKINEQNEYILFTIPQNLIHLSSYINIKCYTIFKIPRFFSIFIIKFIWEQVFLPFYSKYKKIDVLFCPGNFCPLFSPVRTVVMFQNAGPFCRSINVKQVGFYRWFWFKAVGLMMRLSAKRAEHVIFISQYFKKYFINNYGFPADKGKVIYLGRSQDISLSHKESLSEIEEFNIIKPYILFVSHLYPYKNVPQLIEGFGKSIKILNEGRIHLIIAGHIADRKYFSKIIDVVERYRLKEQVQFLGQVPRQKLRGLYNNCLFFIFSSTCENFASVLLEAMSSGSPILCSKLSVMPEICRDAALYFDPYDINDIAEKIVLMTKDENLRKTLRQKGLRRAKEFPIWKKVARETLDVFQEVCHRKTL